MAFSRFICMSWLALACFIYLGCAKGEEQPLATSKGIEELKKTEAEPGTISGVMEPANVEAFIHVFQNGNEVTSVKVKVEADGKYSLQLPPGKYDLKISAEGFKDNELTQVEVLAGKSTEVEKLALKRAIPSPPPPPGGEQPPPPAPGPIPAPAPLVVGTEVGQMAPDFSLDDINSKKVSLKEYQGKKSVLLTFHRGQF